MGKRRLEQIERYIINFFQGVAHLGLEEVAVEDELPALPHPPKSATKMV